MIKNIIISILLFALTSLHAEISSVVSIMPQKVFLEAIGGDKVKVNLMVKAGNSPHTYEPKPSQMIDIAKADIYFSIGIEFEESWLPKFSNQNSSMKIVDMGRGISKIGHDPHIWTSPKNVEKMAKNILDTLVKEDSKNRVYYQQNYSNFIKSMKKLDSEILDILKDIKEHNKFMVFHPAWGYFARDYNLVQVAIEVEGKSPKPREIIAIIKEAKKERVNVVFTAPSFSTKSARQIAKAIGVKVVKISPSHPKYAQNLKNLAKAIAN